MSKIFLFQAWIGKEKEETREWKRNKEAATKNEGEKLIKKRNSECK